MLFLKQHNVHVGPNFTELSKLPKYVDCRLHFQTLQRSES